MNILFLTDSLGYPRVDESKASASDVWTYRIRDVFSKNMRMFPAVKFYFDMKTGRDTRSLLFDVDFHVKSYNPEIIILQVGIVDCYSRALNKIELQILTRIPIIRTLTKYIVKKFYSIIVKKRNIAYVKEDEFKRNLTRLLSSFEGVKWLVIPIAPANSSYIIKNPLIRQRIESYNLILEDVFGSAVLSSIYSSAELNKLYLKDNHHLSIYGHTLVSKRIEPALMELLKC